MTIPTNIILQIDQERVRQDRQWGGPKHDDNHPLQQWVKYVKEHNERAWRAMESKFPDLEEFRQQMVEIAALAIAALESFDRKFASQLPASQKQAMPILGQESGVTITLKRSGYDPTLGRDHPSNFDPTLESDISLQARRNTDGSPLLPRPGTEHLPKLQLVRFQCPVCRKTIGFVLDEDQGLIKGWMVEHHEMTIAYHPNVVIGCPLSGAPSTTVEP